MCLFSVCSKKNCAWGQHYSAFSPLTNTLIFNNSAVKVKLLAQMYLGVFGKRYFYMQKPRVGKHGVLK